MLLRALASNQTHERSEETDGNHASHDHLEATEAELDKGACPTSKPRLRKEETHDYRQNRGSDSEDDSQQECNEEEDRDRTQPSPQQIQGSTQRLSNARVSLRQIDLGQMGPQEK